MMKIIKKVTAILLICCMFSGLCIASAAEADVTSTKYRFLSCYNDAKSAYADFNDNMSDSYSVAAVPGLEKTVFPDGDVCSDMIPQGICFAGNYMLISAYDASGEHNSVIYVVSVKKARSPEYKGMIILPDMNHSGGICFDGAQIWVARSTTKTVASIAYETVIKAADSGFCFAYEYDKVLECESTASFVTYFNGLLWVGLFDKDNEGTLTGYSVSDKLIKKKTFTVPAKSQGAAFTKYGNKTFLAVSCSYGRNSDSNLHIYEADLSAQSLSEIHNLVLPPLCEEIDFYGGRLYLIFESASTKYSVSEDSKCENPIDRVCAIENSKILDSISFFYKIIESFRAVFARIKELF